MEQATGTARQVQQPLNEIQELRFEGYSPHQLADQIDAVHRGGGSASIHNAVDALAKLSNTLAATDEALRLGLNKLNVHWKGAAAAKSTEMLSEKEGFAQDAKSKLDVVAKALFSQGEALTRIRNAVAPEDAELLRKGGDGYSLGDTFLETWLGVVTDHSRAVEAAKEKQSTVAQKFTEYANTSVNGVASMPGMEMPGLTAAREVLSPQSLTVSVVGPAPKPPVATSVLRSKASSGSGISRTNRGSASRGRTSKKSIPVSRRRKSIGTGVSGKKYPGKRSTPRKPVAGRPKYPPKPCPPEPKK